MRRTVMVIAVAVLMLLATPARAITYGQPDGNKHPNVGALVGTFDGQTYPYCSGALISPTVFLTAAHCDIGRAIASRLIGIGADSPRCSPLTSRIGL